MSSTDRGREDRSEYLLGPSDRAWRCDDMLVMGHAAALPKKCIRCNAQENVVMRRRNLSTYNVPLIVALAFFTSPIVAYCIARATRKRATVILGICDPCNNAQKNRSFKGLLLCMGGITLIFVAIIAPVMIFENFTARIIGVFVLFWTAVGLAIYGGDYGSRNREIVSILRIKPRYVWLGEVSPDYLADFSADFPADG